MYINVKYCRPAVVLNFKMNSLKFFVFHERMKRFIRTCVVVYGVLQRSTRKRRRLRRAREADNFISRVRLVRNVIYPLNSAFSKRFLIRVPQKRVEEGATAHCPLPPLTRKNPLLEGRQNRFGLVMCHDVVRDGARGNGLCG